MAEPFKNVFNKKLIVQMAQQFSLNWPAFNQADFIREAAAGIEALELKARSMQIAAVLTKFLPAKFKQAAPIILASLAPLNINETTNRSSAQTKGLSSWAILPLTEYVGRHGLKDFVLSMKLLKALTSRFTSEFGIRFFLLADANRTLKTLKQWTLDPDYHVRRLVSEGTRPRLPWSMQLPQFIKDPTPLIPLLEVLKDDDEEYVRRSVANNLNDIAKDHPALVARIAEQWLKGASANRVRLIKHACRTLIKQGHRQTLKILGYTPAKLKCAHCKILTQRVDLGETLNFTLELQTSSAQQQKLIIDYAVHHRKANGQTSPKVFKWKTTVLKPRSTLQLQKKHPIKKITTRKYYDGVHKLEIFINGVSVALKTFELHLQS